MKLFPFLKYIHPIWYFHREHKGNIPYFIDWEKLDPDEQGKLNIDNSYSSPFVTKLDAAYQAFHRGIIKTDPEFALKAEDKPISLEDNYRFLRRYFGTSWVLYTLAIRLAELNNPIKEVRAFSRTSGTKKVDLYSETLSHNHEVGSFNSELLKSEPAVSVIIPTLNRYEYLKDGLKDLEKQDYKNFNVFVVDQSEPFREDFYKEFNLDLRVIHQEEKALWHARNRSIQESNADLILLYDDDSRVAPDWITNHIKCLDFFQAEISSGVSISESGGEVPRHYNFFRWSDQLDTGNVMIRREVFNAIGLFDRQFEKMRMGDGEFGMRSYLGGFRNISNPLAKRLHLKVGSGGLRQVGSWDAFRTKKLLAPKPIPSVVYYFRSYYPPSNVRIALFKGILLSMIPYRYKRARWMKIPGAMIGLLLFPFQMVSLKRSWKISSRMLKEGPKVIKLKS